MASTPECCAAIQKNLDRLEMYSERNSLKFIKGRSRVLHLRRKNPCTSIGWGLTCSEAALEKWVMVCNKLSISQQCVLMAESHWYLGVY